MYDCIVDVFGRFYPRLDVGHHNCRPLLWEFTYGFSYQTPRDGIPRFIEIQPGFSYEDNESWFGLIPWSTG
jgi:hypothetical protein